MVVLFGAGDPRAIEGRKRMKILLLSVPGQRLEEELMII
jgi:hypothetical protein